MKSEAIRVFVVEDHPVMRQTLRDHIDHAPELVLQGMAASAEEALSAETVLTADVVLVDVSLPGRNGIELVEALLARQASLCCLMLTGHGQQEYVKRALAAGARGYLLKGNLAELMKAILMVASGTIYVGPS